MGKVKTGKARGARGSARANMKIAGLFEEENRAIAVLGLRPIGDDHHLLVEQSTMFDDW